MDLELQGKAALVTGGSKGIGRAIARQLASEGVSVAICARTEADLRAAAVEMAAATGARIVPIRADTSNAEDIKRLVSEAASAFGRLDILVNNAARLGGSMGPEDLAHTTDEMLLGDFETKVLGYLRCIREAVPHMERNGWGRIVNISGMAARIAGGISGSLRNAALVPPSRVLAHELGVKGITVNTVHPGTTLSDTQLAQIRGRAERRGIPLEQALEEGSQDAALRRPITPEEVAYVVAFLCSPKAVSITGEVISVSGGAGRAIFY